MNDQPLPYGWIMEIDPTHNHPYYVDTKANPPRSIWVHPYEDEQYLSEHPDVREKVGKRQSVDGADFKPPVMNEPRRHSYGGEGRRPMQEIAGPSSTPASSDPPKKRGVFGKLKDKAIGTKEEREAEKKRQAEIDRLRQIQYQEQIAALQQQRQQQQYAYGAPMYASPAGAPYQQGGYGGFGGGRRGGRGGLGMPLLGGLAGGLLLGDLIGGGFGGGDFGGGDFGGGGFF